MKKKLFLIVNEDRFFLSHRKPLAVRALEEGFDVTVIAKDTGRSGDVRSLGVKYVNPPVNPTGTNLLQEFKTFVFFMRLFRKERPDVVHNVGLKMMLWGGLAARFRRVPVVISAVSGLGVMFSDGKMSIYAKAVLSALKFSNRRREAYSIFQNNEDKALFLSHGVVKEEQCVFIKGSGVDLAEYAYAPEPEGGNIVVLFTGRMVAEKGVLVLAQAAELLRSEYRDKVEFRLCGGLHSNPLALKEPEIRALCDDTYIKWLGHRDDIREQLINSHIVAFPSYYGEGLPKSLIEASAIGRPIVTCDSVGCRDAVKDGVNGFLVPAKDPVALASRLKTLIDDRGLRVRMGLNSREFAERDYSIDNVVDIHMSLYRRSLNV